MALLTLRSTNPDLSYVITKNPASGVLAKEMRQGKAFGWFTPDKNCTEYNIWFKDSDTEVSYKTHPDENFEYLNATRYNSAMFVLNALSEFFSYTLKKPDPKDVPGFKNEIAINLMYIKDFKYVDIFNRYFDDFSLTVEEKAFRSYKVVASTQKTVKELVSFVNLFAMFNVLKNEQDYFDISDGTAEKYMKCLENIDAPYFVRYVFKINLLRSKKLFDKYRSRLETSGRYSNLSFVPGNTSMSRRDVVSKHLDFKNHIVDIGCGEGFYAHAFANKIEDKIYMAIDTNPDCLETVNHRAKNKQIENISTYSNLDEMPHPYGSVDVLAVEVIEHMPADDAKTLLVKALSTLVVNKMIITTPNAHFNVHYFDDDSSMRHDDHHFEFIPGEFTDFLCKVIDEVYEKTGKKWQVTQTQIGDIVDGQGCTLMAIIEPLKAEEGVA